MRLLKITTMMKRRKSRISNWQINRVLLVIIPFQTLDINPKDKLHLNLEMLKLEKVGQQKWLHIEKESIIIKTELHIL